MTLKRTLIGMLTPSSNTVLEPYMCAILHQLLPHVTAHFQRFTVREISMDDKAMAQFKNEPLIEAAKVLSDARMRKEPSQPPKKAASSPNTTPTTTDSTTDTRPTIREMRAP